MLALREGSLFPKLEEVNVVSALAKDVMGVAI